MILSTPDDYQNPDWDEPNMYRKIGEWRNHVGERTRKIWPSLSDEQKEAIALDAEERAMDVLESMTD